MAWSGGGQAPGLVASGENPPPHAAACLPRKAQQRLQPTAPLLPRHGVAGMQDYHPATGAVQGRYTQQGLAANSTWARGQAWAVAGFARMWRQTGRKEFLAAARKTSDW